MIVIPFENCSARASRVTRHSEPSTMKIRTNILPRGVERVEVVQVGESAEELLRAAHLVANHDAALARALDLEDLDDWAVTLLHAPHNVLVDVERVLARLLQEDRVRDCADVRLAVEE